MIKNPKKQETTSFFIKHRSVVMLYMNTRRKW